MNPPAISSEAALCTEDVLRALRRPIAVVGNGQPDRPMGGLIDRHATIIRLNNFAISGHETIVGQRTSIRVTSGWEDIRHYDQHLELSPFTEGAHESLNLARYRADNAVPILTARTDVHELLPDLPKPSTGLSLLALFSHLGIPVAAFGFDGFRTGHYWQPDPTFSTVHSANELNVLLALPGITLHGRSHPHGHLHHSGDHERRQRGAAGQMEQTALDEASLLERMHPRDPAIAGTAADLRYTAGDLAGSLASARRAARLTPDDADAHFRVARAALRLERIEVFENALARTLDLDARHPDALRLLARLQLDHGWLAEAGALYATLLEMDRDDAEALEGALVCHLRAGDHDRAAALLQRHPRCTAPRRETILEIA